LAGILTVIIFSIGRRRVLYPKRSNLWRVGLVSCFQTIIQYTFFYIGLANTTGVKGTVISGSSTFFAILISCFIFKMEKLNLKKIVACILGFSGIIVINLKGLTFDMNFMGDCFVIFSSISMAMSSALTKVFSKDEDPVTISGYQFFVGGIVLMLIGAAFGGRIQFNSLGGVAVLLYLAFLSAVAYSLWGILLKFNPVSKVTIYCFTTPLFGVLLSELMLTENGNVTVPSLIITLILISAGILLLNYKKPEKPNSKEE
jgi:drug/metabolite transporter (DMT)-like permease